MDHKYLMFQLNNEEYAVEVAKIKEVINYSEAVEVPNASPYVKGVISRGGVVIPLLNLKKCFGFPDTQPNKKVRIIVIGHKQHIAGLPVDSIVEVKSLTSNKVSPVPQFMEKEKVEFLRGIIECDDRFIMVLKTSALLECLRYEN